MNPEHRYRSADHDLPPLSPPEFVADHRVNTNLFREYGLLAIILLAGMICIALTLASRAATMPKDQTRFPREIDLAFERYVDREARQLFCPGRRSMFPIRCGKWGR